MPSRPVRLLPLLFACAWPVAVSAQGTADGGHPCAATVDPTQRLACYDRAFPPPPAVREAAAARAVDAFGLPRAATPLRGPGASAGDGDPDAIEARVTAVEHAGGRRTVLLANGQRWSVEGGVAGPLAAGDLVTIRKGALGSHMLRTPGGVSLRARRVR
ncbi:hypothetical protein [Luteimonas sp. YGD11-2]|uniref:hypothetical protein n=1 Tax=Luteimonas sp. YGD11-2 TaxID=2508168 RepID=UPI00100BB558|nr:hypothetical protein [Luteimonas sp. YGD11-2]